MKVWGHIRVWAGAVTPEFIALNHVFCPHSCFEPFFSCSVAVSEYVEAFDEIVSNLVAQYLSLSQKIGGDVQKHVGYSSGAECSKMCLFDEALTLRFPAADANFTLRWYKKLVSLTKTFLSTSSEPTSLSSLTGRYDEAGVRLSETAPRNGLLLPEALWCESIGPWMFFILVGASVNWTNKSNEFYCEKPVFRIKKKPEL